ncbi:hypothetical protein DFAR_1110023 [Desulfarculales bacterium]
MGAAGVDLDDKPGPALLQVLEGERVLFGRTLTVKPRDYGTRKITVGGEFMELSSEDLARHQDEIAWQNAMFASRLPRML